MSLQSLLAKAGLRTATLGTAASLAFAFPLAEGSYDPAAHTDASRIGFWCDRTLSAEAVGVSVMGVDALIIGETNATLAGDLSFSKTNARLYDDVSVPSYDVTSRTVFDTAGVTSVDAANRFLSGTTGTSIDYEQHFLYDASSVLSADYTGRALYDTASNITLDWNNLTLGTVGSAQVWSIAVAPSTVSAATLNIEPGTAPSAPVDGDLWTDTTGLYVQINGVTVGPLSAGGGGGTIGGTATAGRVAYGTGANTIGSSAGFTYDSTLSQFSTSQTVLAASGAGAFDATFFRTTRAPSNTNSVTQFAIEAQADLTGSGAANPGTITAVFASAFNNMTGGSLANLNGVVANLQSNGNTGMTTAAYGFKAQVSVGVGNTITTYYGLYLSSPSVSGTITTKYGVYQQSATDLNFFAGVVAVGGATPSASTALVTPASTISISSLRISHGVAPTSPINGDVWTTTGGFFVRINGSTQQLISAASSTASTLPYWNSSSQLAATTWAMNFTGGTYQLDTTAAGSAATNSASQVSLGMSWQGTLNASAVIRTLGVSCTPSVSGLNASSSYYSVYATLLPSLTSSLRYTSSDMCAIYGSTSFQGSATSGTSVNTIRGAQFDINVTMSGASGTTTIPNVYGVHVRPASFSSATGGTTTISAYYGIYLDTLTTSGSGTTTITNRYGVYQSDASAMNNFAGVTGIGAAPSSTTRLLLAASTTGVSSLRLPHGTAPTAPVDGDMWTTTAGLFVRINGSTVGPLT